jgi:SMODS and SLOG-associating 2TM effector domain 1/Protein of unknown function (DUF4231)
MIDAAWNEYRGWAQRARKLQEATARWNKAALISAAIAALCGAGAGHFGAATGPGRSLSLLAAIAAAMTAFLGKEIIALGNEAKWIRARATAEALKSECFRFAVRLGEYAGPKALDSFFTRRDAVIKAATDAGLTPMSDPVPQTGDERRPPVPLDADWYLRNRLDEQIWFYSQKAAHHERVAERLWYVSFGAASTAALLGILGAVGQDWIAPWIGVMTTLATAVAAYGLLDRRKYLAANYSALASSLNRIREKFLQVLLTPDELVAAVEDLLQSEHAAWIEAMTKTIAAPPAAELQKKTA